MKIIITTLILVLLTGCSSIDMKRYSANEIQLDLYSYFSGKTKGWGIVQDRKGELIRQFVVDIHGEVTDKGQLILRENFDWSDGEQSSRTWVLSRVDDHNLTGTADDVSGQADGRLYGNVLNWTYQLSLIVDGSTWKISFDDWIFQVSDSLLLNRATMSKFGFKVGEITIVFQKEQHYNRTEQ